MIENHACADLDGCPGWRDSTTVTPCFRNKAHFVQQLVAFEHFLLVPAGAVCAKTQADSGAPQLARFGIGRRGSERVKNRQNGGCEHRRCAVAPVFPRKKAVPVPPQHARQRFERAARQRQISDGNDPRSLSLAHEMTAAIAKSVKLLDISKLYLGLLLHPVAQS